MGFLEKLFGRNAKDRAAEGAADAPQSAKDEGNTSGDIAPELASALQSYQQGRHEAAIAAAAPHVDRHADANRLCALAYSDMLRYPEAFPYWLALFNQEPSAHNALQLATTSVMCGELDRGEAWLMKFDEINEQTHELSSVTARTQFVSALKQSGHMAEALPYLAWIRDVMSMRMSGLPTRTSSTCAVFPFSPASWKSACPSSGQTCQTKRSSNGLACFPGNWMKKAKPSLSSGCSP